MKAQSNDDELEIFSQQIQSMKAHGIYSKN